MFDVTQAMWCTGEGKPSGTPYQNSYLYIDSLTGNTYQYINSDWQFMFSMGATNSTPGARGATITFGTELPTDLDDSTFVSGDIFIDQTNMTVYQLEGSMWDVKGILQGNTILSPSSDCECKDGVDGTMWYCSASQPSSANARDIWYNTATYDICQYLQTNSTLNAYNWVILGNLKGNPGKSYSNDGSVDLNVSSIKSDKGLIESDGKGSLSVQSLSINGSSAISKNDLKNYVTSGSEQNKIQVDSIYYDKALQTFIAQTVDNEEVAIPTLDGNDISVNGNKTIGFNDNGITIDNSKIVFKEGVPLTDPMIKNSIWCNGRLLSLSQYIFDNVDNLVYLYQNIPLSDPKCNNQLWNNNGILMVSQGDNPISENAILLFVTTTDPMASGQLWSDGGILRISHGSNSIAPNNIYINSNLPETDPSQDKQLWSNGSIVSICQTKNIFTVNNEITQLELPSSPTKCEGQLWSNAGVIQISRGNDTPDDTAILANLSNTDDGSNQIWSDGDVVLLASTDNTNGIKIPDLPIIDPHTNNQVWNNGKVLMVSQT